MFLFNWLGKLLYGKEAWEKQDREKARRRPIKPKPRRRKK